MCVCVMRVIEIVYTLAHEGSLLAIFKVAALIDAHICVQTLLKGATGHDDLSKPVLTLKVIELISVYIVCVRVCVSV